MTMSEHEALVWCEQHPPCTIYIAPARTSITVILRGARELIWSAHADPGVRLIECVQMAKEREADHDGNETDY